MADNISTVFGSIFLSSLIPITVDIETNTMEDEEENSSSVTLDTSTDIESNIHSYDANNISMEPPHPIDATKVSPTSETPVPTVPIRIRGYVSKVGKGVGRSDNERQFLFLNQRPVDILKITKVINEVIIKMISYSNT